MKDQHFSGLTARCQLNQKDVDGVKATVTLTATVNFWRDAYKAIEGDAYGAWQVKAAIRSVIEQAEQTFYHRIEPTAEKPE